MKTAALSGGALVDHLKALEMALQQIERTAIPWVNLFRPVDLSAEPGRRCARAFAWLPTCLTML
jgi:hypothetical protein